MFQLEGNSILNFPVKVLRFTVDLNGAACGCNAALYLTSGPSPYPGRTGNFECDASGSRAGGWCSELDLMEANSMAFQTTIHACPAPGHGPSGLPNPPCESKGLHFGHMQKQYGPGPGHKIDSTRPFAVTISFLPGEHLTIRVMLVQGELYTFKEILQADGMWPALNAGMNVVVSYWSSTDMHWLDTPPCSVDTAMCPPFLDISDLALSGDPAILGTAVPP